MRWVRSIPGGLWLLVPLMIAALVVAVLFGIAVSHT